jgi:hypothetical protein
MSALRRNDILARAKGPLVPGVPAIALRQDAFRAQHGFAPSKFSRTAWQKRKDCIAWPLVSDFYLREYPAMNHTPLPVTLEERTAVAFARIRVRVLYRRPNALAAAWSRLHTWLAARGLDAGSLHMIGMSNDDPEVTPLPVAHDRSGRGLPPHEGSSSRAHSAGLVLFVFAGACPDRPALERNRRVPQEAAQARCGGGLKGLAPRQAEKMSLNYVQAILRRPRGHQTLQRVQSQFLSAAAGKWCRRSTASQGGGRSRGIL